MLMMHSMYVNFATVKLEMEELHFSFANKKFPRRQPGAATT
jgi:hypothetical protein